MQPSIRSTPIAVLVLFVGSMVVVALCDGFAPVFVVMVAITFGLIFWSARREAVGRLSQRQSD
jgi:hypothetical protein